jgi:hypothetical protein
VKLSTIVLAIAFAAPSTLALAGPMNLADPVLVPSQASTSPDDHTDTWQTGHGFFQRYDSHTVYGGSAVHHQPMYGLGKFSRGVGYHAYHPPCASSIGEESKVPPWSFC